MRGLAIVVLCLGACGASSSDGQRYELVCDAANTKDQSTLFCVRVDTRTGELRSIDVAKTPQTDGAAARSGPDWTYQVVCDSTDTETKSDFRCLRLDRRSGDVELVALPRLRPL
jgi:hypothetical protein